MISKRFYLVLLGIIGLLLVAMVAGAYGANSLLTARANKLTELKAKSVALSQQQLSLTKARKDIKKYADLKKIAQSVVPQDKNQAEAVREIVNIAAANTISLASITFPASTLGTSPNGTAVTPKPSTNSKTGSLSQLLPVKSIPGVYQLPISIQGDPAKPVPYAKFINFLSALEHNRRTAQVSAITLEPSTTNRDLLTFTLSVSEYIKP